MAGSIRKLVEKGTKILAVYKNYAPTLDEPLFYLKPTTSYLHSGGTIKIPPSVSSLHAELQLAVVIKKKTCNVKVQDAMDHVAGYALALNMMTAKDIPTEKFAGLKWKADTGRDTFTPIGCYLPKLDDLHPDNLKLWLKVDGIKRQEASTNDMTFQIPYLINRISSLMTLKEGDVILTGISGTSQVQGVDPVTTLTTCQKITAGIYDHQNVEFKVEKISDRVEASKQVPEGKNAAAGRDQQQQTAQSKAEENSDNGEAANDLTVNA